MSLTIQLQDAATPTLQAVSRALAPSERMGLMNVLGRQGQVIYRSWFRRRDSQNKNRQGWPRQHIWSGIARVTAHDPSKTTPTQAVVVVSSPILPAKIRGAVIRPTGGRRLLAIPMRPEAYGVRPSSGIIPGLRFLGGRFGGPMYLGKREDGPFGNLVRYYRLVPKVTLRPDPQALPPPEAVAGPLRTAASSYLARAITRR